MLKMTDLLRASRAVVRRVRAGCRAFERALAATEYSCSSFSQYGEDMVLRAIFARYPVSYQGFYVDVGAHHPKRYSNSCYFYQRQWSGICIDPIPNGSALFARHRPKDVFLPIGVAEQKSILTYYMFREPGYNTFSPEVASSYPFKWERIASVPVRPLRAILAEHLPLGQAIDFLAVDAEGLDLVVVRSNDWTRYRPKVVVTEALDMGSADQAITSEIGQFMKAAGYVLSGRSPSALYFLDAKSSGYDGSPFLNPS
jgi:Methyltransferase FkbM domain